MYVSHVSKNLRQNYSRSEFPICIKMGFDEAPQPQRVFAFRAPGYGISDQFDFCHVFIIDYFLWHEEVVCIGQHIARYDV